MEGLMTPEEGTTVVLTVMWCGLLVLLLALRRGHRGGLLLMRLFGLHGELIDYATKNDVPFQCPAFVMLSHSINSMTRFSRDMDFTRFLLLSATRRIQPPRVIAEFDRQWLDALDRLPSSAHRERIADFRERALLEVSKHMAWRSIPAILARLNVASVNRLWLRRRRTLLRRARILEIDAVMRSDRLHGTAGT